MADLEKVGERIGQAKDSYDAAYGKLSAQRSNMIRQAEMLKEFGIKPSKALPPSLIEASQDEDAPLSAAQATADPAMGAA